MNEYPIHVIVVDDRDPTEAGIIDFDTNGKKVLSRIVGRKKAQRFLFEHVVNLNHIIVKRISIADRNGVQIFIYDGEAFLQGYERWYKENVTLTLGEQTE